MSDRRGTVKNVVVINKVNIRNEHVVDYETTLIFGAERKQVNSQE